MTYADLRLVRSELDELMEAALEAGIIRQRIAYERYVDDSFQRSARPVADPCGASRPPGWLAALGPCSCSSWLWHVGGRRQRQPIFPTPWQVATGLADLARQGLLVKHVVASLFRVTWGYLLAAVARDSRRDR